MTSAPRLRPRLAALAPAFTALAFVVCYVPFVGVPFRMDDPAFIWVARHVQAHPADFYGFRVNWHGTETGMWEVMKNPPLASYYMAAAAYVVGWSEIALHLAFLLPALGAVLGTYELARVLSARPVDASLAFAFTPVFFVSSTSVMCDVLMVSAWVWSVVFWIRGLNEHRPLLLGASALLGLAASLTKYFGIALIPLLLAHGAVRERRLGAWLAWPCIPLAGLALYQWYTARLYGRGLLLDAASYADAVRARHSWNGAAKLATGLLFAGGCYFNALFYAPRLWSRRALVTFGIAAAVLAALLAGAGAIGSFALRDAEGLRWGALTHCAVFLAIASSVVTLWVLDLACDRRSPEALLLFLWTAGTLLFAFRLNWSVNARSLLPAAPAMGILVSRRMARRDATAPATASARQAWTRLWPLAPAALACVVLAYADGALATSARDAASHFASAADGRRAAWFQGHWGFQYYAEALGLRPMDYRRTFLDAGDLVVAPEMNSNLFRLPPGKVSLQRVAEWPAGRFVATMAPALGAGFYSDAWGPLPFAVGPAPGDRYDLFEVLVPMGP